MHALVVIGTRPEAIKVALVIHELRKKGAKVTLLTTNQHTSGVLEALALFDITPDHQLPVTDSNDFEIAHTLSRFIDLLGSIIPTINPDIVITQGDTTSTLACTLAAFYSQKPVAHIEAGLHTDSISSPFPEEGHRRAISALATLHFAPSVSAKNNLIAQGISPSAIVVSGNPVIDAALSISKKAPDFISDPTCPLNKYLDKRFVLITAHRRECLGAPRRSYFAGLKESMLSFPDIAFIFLRHSNPLTHEGLADLENQPNFHVEDVLPYGQAIFLIKHALLVVTDSGGLQEECGLFGVPCILMREETERSDLVESANVIIARDGNALKTSIEQCMHENRERLTSSYIYGSGDAAKKIANAIHLWHSSKS